MTDTESSNAPGADAAGSLPGLQGASVEPSDWNALCRLADAVGTADNPVTQIRGRHPARPQADNGGAQAVCSHDDDFEGVVTSDGARHPLDLTA